MKKSLFQIFCILFYFSSLDAQNYIMINNVSIFNGKESKLIIGNVLIENNLIKTISTSPIVTNKSGRTTIIDGKGKFLMPGLIDAHAHMLMDAMPIQVLMTADFSYINLYAGKAAEQQLMRGFTSVRDVGGNSFGLKRAIDEGFVTGPRIYPSGATISQSGGHGDFGFPSDVPRKFGRDLSYMEINNMTQIADGPDQVTMRVREQLRQGASQIKLMAGGGVSSHYDPIDVTQYSEAEFKAAVDAAENWGTYVTIHAYTPKAITRAVNAGVKCVEHGQLIDEPTAKLLADKGVWLCLQPFLDDEDANPQPEGTENRAKQLMVSEGTDNAYKLAKKYNIKTAFGTDCLFNAKLAARQGAKLVKLTKWYSPFEVLKMATSTNGELLAFSGLRSPYRQGKLGVIEEGAYADLLVVDGNPIENIKLIEDPEKNFLLIMKNGTVYKNTLTE